MNVPTMIISLIWGFGLIILITKICFGDQCVINKVPQSFNGTIIDANKCYRLSKYPTKCL